MIKRTHYGNWISKIVTCIRRSVELNTRTRGREKKGRRIYINQRPPCLYYCARRQGRGPRETADAEKFVRLRKNHLSAQIEMNACADSHHSSMPGPSSAAPSQTRTTRPAHHTRGVCWVCLQVCEPKPRGGRGGGEGNAHVQPPYAVMDSKKCHTYLPRISSTISLARSKGIISVI